MADLPTGLSESLRAEIKRYQDVTEKLRLVLLNKQQVQVQLSEVENALRELSRASGDAAIFKILGNIMVAKPRDEIESELSERKETLEIRIKSLERQEQLLRKQLEELEKKLTRKLGGPGEVAG